MENRARLAMVLATAIAGLAACGRTYQRMLLPATVAAPDTSANGGPTTATCERKSGSADAEKMRWKAYNDGFQAFVNEHGGRWSMQLAHQYWASHLPTGHASLKVVSGASVLLADGARSFYGPVNLIDCMRISGSARYFVMYPDGYAMVSAAKGLSVSPAHSPETSTVNVLATKTSAAAAESFFFGLTSGGPR